MRAMVKVLKYLLVMAMVLVAISIWSVNVTYAQQSYPTFTVEDAFPWNYVLLTPWPAPWWNPYASGNLIGWAGTYMPLAEFDDSTGQWWPVLAENWTIFPQNQTLIIHLRRGLYWFNGSATIPFTAWDVYAEFYIGVKAFDWFYPYLTPQNADKDIIVINNYTISIHFDHWTATGWVWPLIEWIITPWPVWEKVVSELKTMNASQAWTFGQKNISEMVVPYWGLSPYYVTQVSPSEIWIQLEPEYFNGKPLLATWDEILPFHTWQYFPKIGIYIGLSGGVTQLLTLAVKSKDFYIPSWFSTPPDYAVFNKSGYTYYTMPDISIVGFNLPLYYPFTIPQVRQAFLYIINRTEAALAFGPSWVNVPVYINVPAPAPNVLAGFWLTFPEDIRAMVVNFTQPNWTKAAQLLESAGLYYKNGQWYLPNGTPLTLNVYASSTSLLFWILDDQEAAVQVSKFGIKTTFYTLEPGIWSQLWPCGLSKMGATADWLYAGSPKGGVNTAWIYYDIAQYAAGGVYESGFCANFTGSTVTPFAYPIVQNNQIVGWYCKPLTTNFHIPNNTVITCVNSTFGYINLTNWENAITAAEPGSGAYYDLVKAYFAWFEYWVPGVEIAEGDFGAVFPKNMIDPMWAYDCMPYTNPKYTAAAYSLLYNWGIGWGWDGFNPQFNVQLFMGAFAPPGVMPALAQAIVNGSLWTKTPQFAAFIGLPTPDPELQACVASYFHTTYTPVTTSTTTTSTTTTTTTTTTATAVSTVTSTTTVTSTVTTTAVSTTTTATTVTVTKPVISTALVIGIVVVVIVIAAVVAVIALRRR